MNWAIAEIAPDGLAIAAPDKTGDRRAKEQQPHPTIPETLPPGDNAGSAGQVGEAQGYQCGIS